MVTLSADDLLAIVELAISKTKDEMMPLMASAAQERDRAKKEVMEKFKTCDTFLWQRLNGG